MQVFRGILLLFPALLINLQCFAAPQASDAAAAADSSDSLAAIIVTAQKRSESLIKVPIAVTVVSGSLLQANDITNAQSLEQVVPTLTYKQGSTNSNSLLSLRGIGTQSFSPAAEPSVAMVVDGVVMGRSGMNFTEFTDITRIEVLPGPQGTLFGINSSAGVINIITPSPTQTFKGDASASWFQGGEYHANVNVSGPITPTLGYTLSAIYSDYPGNVENVYDDKKVNGFRRNGVRGKLVDDLTDSLKLTLAGDYVHANDLCCADVLGSVIPNSMWTNVFAPTLLPAVPGPHNMQINNNWLPVSIDTNAGASAQVDWDFSGYTLTSITAFRRWYNFQQRDGDFTSTCCNYVASLDSQLQDQGGLTYKQYSEEVRLASPTHQFLEYVVGAFVWHTDEEDYFNRFDDSCTASTLPADATGFKPCQTGLSTFVATTGQATFDTKDDNSALFGQATMNITDRFRLIGGARYTRDYVAYSFNREDFPTTGAGIGAPFEHEGDTSHSGGSGKAGAQFDFTDSIIGYATYSHGYKGPAYNVFFNMSALNTAPIAPETSNAYEIGLKNNLFHNQLTLNLAAYVQNYDNFQANSFVVTNGAVTTSLTNAGSVRSSGFEADFDWRPTDNFSVRGGYAYDKAIIVSYLCAGQTGAALASCQGVHNGAQLPFAPLNKFDVTPSWLLPLGGIPFTTRLNATYSYTSETNYDIDQTPLARQPGYGLLGAAVVFGSLDDRYHLSLIGKNLTNQFYTVFITPTGNGVTPLSYERLQIPRDAQRYFGVTLSVNF